MALGAQTSGGGLGLSGGSGGPTGAVAERRVLIVVRLVNVWDTGRAVVIVVNVRLILDPGWGMLADGSGAMVGESLVDGWFLVGWWFMIG